jgi:hypothetical protein
MASFVIRTVFAEKLVFLGPVSSRKPPRRAPASRRIRPEGGGQHVWIVCGTTCGLTALPGNAAD